MIPPVVASDRGRAQTVHVAMHVRGCRTTLRHVYGERNVLESSIGEGDNPVLVAVCGRVVS